MIWSLRHQAFFSGVYNMPTILKPQTPKPRMLRFEVRGSTALRLSYPIIWKFLFKFLCKIPWVSLINLVEKSLRSEAFSDRFNQNTSIIVRQDIFFRFEGWVSSFWVSGWWACCRPNWRSKNQKKIKDIGFTTCPQAQILNSQRSETQNLTLSAFQIAHISFGIWHI